MPPDMPVPIPNICALMRKQSDHKIFPQWAFKQISPYIPEYKEVGKYIVNHSKKEFVSLHTLPKDADGWQIHPLPLLTCDSFGGGGSYHGKNEYCGAWVNDVISVEEKPPKGYTRIKPDFVE